MGKLSDAAFSGELFDQQAFARSSDPVTSHAAAAKTTRVVNHLEAEVYEAIKVAGARGATWDELGASTGIDKASISPRFKPLRTKMLIRAARDADGNLIKRDGQIAWVAI